MSHSISRANLGVFFLSHKLAVVNLSEQTRHMNNCSYVIARPLPFPWPGAVGWALGRVSAHKRSVCRVSEANRTRQRTNVHEPTFAMTFVNYWPSFIACAVWAQRTEHVSKTRQLPCQNHANCRGIHCTYIVHTQTFIAVIGKISSHWITLDTQVSHG